MQGHESQRDFANGSELLLPPITLDGINHNAANAFSNRQAIPRQMSQISKKNNALIANRLKASKLDSTLETAKMDKLFKTEDNRGAKATPVDQRLTKGERDDLVSNYFTDKKKFKWRLKIRFSLNRAF